jgi:AcrR family transcriptional regulator
MPRPRTLSDADLLAATQRVVTRLGPTLTLADIAREAGVSAATLVQRFGSKRALLLAFAAAGSHGTRDQFEAIRAQYPDPLDALHEIVRCYARMAPSPEAVSNGLAFLQMDMTDPDFHQPALAGARDTLDELERLLDAAVRTRRLRRCDTRRMARALYAAIGGAMLAWAILREGTAESMMLEAVETLIDPHVLAGRAGSGRKPVNAGGRTRATRSRR